MATNFKYASQSDITKYFNRVSDFDSKRQIFPTLTSGNLHLFRDSGYVDKLFVNGEELAAAQSTSGAVDSNGEWFYASGTNQVEYYNSNYSSTTINEQMFEAGQDFSDFLDQALVDASLELHNYLDRRYSTPLQKNNQIDTSATIQVDNIASEYDAIIIKSTCYIAAANLIRAKEGASEEADYYNNLVTNPERTGIIDKLNDGFYKLSYEYTNTSKAGKIRASTVNSTMELIEITGEYTGEKFDVLAINVTVGGAYGTAKFTVKHFGNDRLFGTTSNAEVITGAMQHIYGGVYGRWEGASADTSDYYEIVVYGKGQKHTNKSNATIEMVR